MKLSLSAVQGEGYTQEGPPPLPILMLDLEGADHSVAGKDEVSTADDVCQFWTRLGQRAGAARFIV